MKWQIILQIIMLIVGIAIFFYRRYLIRKCSIRVSAVIVDIVCDASQYANLRRYHPNYPTYKYKIGHCWYTEKSQVELPRWGRFPKQKVGDKMDVLVSESDPKFCIPADYADFRKGPQDFMIGLLAFFVVIALFFVS